MSKLTLPRLKHRLFTTAESDRYLAAYGRQVVMAVETCGDKHCVPGRAIEADHDAAAERSDSFRRKLGDAS